jgi:hypothetical protein
MCFIHAGGGAVLVSLDGSRFLSLRTKEFLDNWILSAVCRVAGRKPVLHLQPRHAASRQPPRDGAEQDRARSVHAHHAPRSYGRGGAAGRVAERGARETESEMLVLSREMDSYWPVELKASSQCPKRKAYEVCVVSRVWVWPCAWKQAYGNGISRKRIPSPLRYRTVSGSE